MPIVKKSDIERHKKALEKYYLALIKELEGTKPSENVWEQHTHSLDAYLSNYRYINDINLRAQASSFNSVLSDIKKIKPAKK
jgi:hypothetical protein